MQIDVPRDREGTFDPKIVTKHPHRLTAVDDVGFSLDTLAGSGLERGHEADLHACDIGARGAGVSKFTVNVCGG